MLRPILKAVLVCLLLTIAAVPSMAAGIEQSDSKLYTRALERMMEELPLGDLPASLVTKSDVYLFIDAGGAYVDVKVLAQPTTSGPALATALSKAVSTTDLGRSTVEWAVDDYTVAEVSRTHPHPLSMTASTDVPIASIVNGLQSAGYRVHPLLRVRNYGRTIPRLPSTLNTTNFHWYTNPALSSSPVYHVSASVAPAVLAILAALAIFPTVVVLLVLEIATKRAKKALESPGVIVNQERQRFIQSTASTPFAFVMLLGFSGTFLLARGGGQALSDVWAGSPTGFPFIIGPVCCLSILPYILISTRRRRVLFGNYVSDVQAAMSPEEKKLTTRATAASTLPHLLFAILAVTASIAIHTPWARQLHSFAPMLTIVAGGALGSLYKRRIKSLTVTTADDSLTWRAQQLAVHFNKRIHTVLIDQSGRGKTRAFCTLAKEEMTVSQMLVDTFTPEELDYAMASAMATQPLSLNRTFSLMFILMFIPVVFIACLVPLTLTKTLVLSGMNYGQILVGMALLMAVLMALPLIFIVRSRRSRFDNIYSQASTSDIAAVEVTRDYDAALSALKKLADSHLQDATVTSDKDKFSSRAQWQTRIANLEQLAQNQSKILL